MDFKPFNKIPRLNRECVITEKIDGTNAQITITDDGKFLTGSRNRWITPDNDNYGFSRWAHDNKEELLKLGVGSHFGEWWGCGIQRGYGIDEKRFSLFNVSKWSDESIRPKCCCVVPLLYKGMFKTETVGEVIDSLRSVGSSAVMGYDKPEGVVVFHTSSGVLFKVTCENDEKPKSSLEEKK